MSDLNYIAEQLLAAGLDNHPYLQDEQDARGQGELGVADVEDFGVTAAAVPTTPISLVEYHRRKNQQPGHLVSVEVDDQVIVSETVELSGHVGKGSCENVVEQVEENDGEDESSSSESASSSSDSDSSDASDLEGHITELSDIDDNDEEEDVNFVGEDGLRTRNEMTLKDLPPVEAPVVTHIPEQHPIHALGKITGIVDLMLLITSYPVLATEETPQSDAIECDYDGSAQDQKTSKNLVLDVGSIVCFSNRLVIGEVFDTFGPVHQPIYCVRFNSQQDIDELFESSGLSDSGMSGIGLEVFTSMEYSKCVLMGLLRGMKGTDASNLHDEELPENEQEFSDDEKEQQVKSLLKKGKSRKRNRNPPQQQQQPQVPQHQYAQPPFPIQSNYPGVDQIRMMPIPNMPYVYQQPNPYAVQQPSPYYHPQQPMPMQQGYYHPPPPQMQQNNVAILQQIQHLQNILQQQQQQHHNPQ